ncbi:stage III sporulation protein AF [Paenibacillus chartarius]|uniref:Stage III sporulation protein AF n=1 Tax=Paenibacillus chartarius TaxID=747481 RepID=A0ABV6DNJ0_9BACL
MLSMGEWLRTVISVILLATFVDLLLPNSSMQRYVRTVMSLFILLTLLAPLVQLFQRNWGPERLFSLVETEQVRMAAAEQLGRMPSLEAVEQKAQQLKAANAQQERRLVEAQLGSQIRDRLQTETSLTVASVRVTTGKDASDKPYIQEVEVTLAPPSQSSPAPEETDEARQASGKPLSIEIKPVDPIRVRIQDQPDQYTAEEPSVPASGGTAPPEYRQAQAAVTRVLVQEYQLPASRIRTSYAGSAQAS